MWGSDNAVYGLKYGGRCIVAQANPPNMMATSDHDSSSDHDSDSELGLASKHYFLLGTTSLRESNELHQVEFNEETGDLRCTAVYGHPDEMWHLAPNPNDSTMLCTIHSHTEGDNSTRAGTLWRFPTEAPPADSPLKVMPLEKLCSIPGDDSSSDLESESELSEMVDFSWETHGGRCMSVTRKGIRIMSLKQQEGKEEKISFHVEITITPPAAAITSSSGRGGKNNSGDVLLSNGGDVPLSSSSFLTGFSQGRFDPHHRNEIVAIVGGHVYGYDLRQCDATTEAISEATSEATSDATTILPAWCILNAHTQMTYDVDYNPNKPYCLMTCGDDCLIKFWDVRKITKRGDEKNTKIMRSKIKEEQPIAVLRNHTHWVRTSKYNPFHDQLVLSAGSDAAVDLWRISSISSAPLLEMDDDDNGSGSGSGGDDDENDRGDGGGSSGSGGGVVSSPKSSTTSKSMNRRSSSGEAGGGGALDTLITRFDEAHEESVYSVAWSVAEAWTFASLSCDGRMVVNTVPSTEKYKILL